ncbi:MAG TPA: hypothetical protein VN844_01010 [Pyrinomonadaceae bacterium]|nr:hypothetical protein [Pyrinomonadaceae bacterium]
MPIQESSATALVRFTGLGIVCFNQEHQRGEIAGIRDNKHVLTIKIQRPVYQDGAEKDVIAYKDVVTYENLPNDDVRIEIKASGNPPIAGYEIYQNGEFDRLGAHDVNDFRWLVNMSTLHGDSALQTSPQQRYPLTKIYISNGLFYAHKLDRNLFFEKVEKNANGLSTLSEVFGNVAETIGVKLEGAEVQFTIRIGSQEETHSLPRIEGLPFRIEIKNMDYNANAIYSDMPDYYKYFADPSGNQFELMPIVEDASVESINQQEFCHPIVVDHPQSIDDL